LHPMSIQIRGILAHRPTDCQQPPVVKNDKKHRFNTKYGGIAQ